MYYAYLAIPSIEMLMIHHLLTGEKRNLMVTYTAAENM